MTSSTLERDGVLIRERVLPREAVEEIRHHFDAIESGRAGARQFDLPDSITSLIGSHGLLGVLATREAGCDARPVRVLLFDKTPASNWAVPWHQDRTVAVRERIDIDGYGPWSVKGGVVHVEPPLDIVKGMLTLRVFVDDCGDDNGPLEVAIGSHQLGRLAGKDMSEAVRHNGIFVGQGRAGDVLVMKTLAVHSSKRAASPCHRRVLQVDYATMDLAAPLEWMLD
jgi:hypothetical protein